MQEALNRDYPFHPCFYHVKDLILTAHMKNDQRIRTRKPGKTNLSGAVLVKVLLLDSGAKVESDIVNEIGGVLGNIQYHEVKVQPHNTASQNQKHKYP